MQNLPELPSVKLRDGADLTNPEEPIMALSGRDLTGTPQVIVMTQSQAEMVSRRLLEMTVGVRVGKFVQADEDHFGREGGTASV